MNELKELKKSLLLAERVNGDPLGFSVSLAGSPGGGEVFKKSFPKFVPPQVISKYLKDFQHVYSVECEKAGYGDDEFGYSEGSLGEARGFVVISAEKLSDSEIDDRCDAIVYWTIDPIPFKGNDGKKYFLYAGVAGV